MLKREVPSTVPSSRGTRPTDCLATSLFSISKVINKERIQLLYLLKSQKAKTITQASEFLGRHRVTVQDWLAKYRQGGLENLLGRSHLVATPLL